MICANSNCSRIDAVKATANQLKLQTAKKASPEDPDSSPARAVRERLQSLDDSIKSGDATKAELALSNARSALREDGAGSSTADDPRPERGNFRSFLAYA